MHFAHLNVRSLTHKCDLLYELLISDDISVISFNETWLSEGISNSFLNFVGFKIHRLDRCSKGGGVMLAVKNNIPSTTENTLQHSSIELIHVSLLFRGASDVNIVSIYRPPASNITDFITQLNYFLSNLNYVDSPLIILGDINIDCLVSSCNLRSLKRLLKQYNLSILNNSPTRVTASSSTCIDLIICNNVASKFINNIYTKQYGISDHDIVGGFLKRKNIASGDSYTTISYRRVTPEGVNQFNRSLINYSINDLIICNAPGIDKKFSVYIDYMNNLTNKYFPTRFIKLKSTLCANIWYSSELRHLCRERDKAHHKSRRSKDHLLHSHAKYLRNRCLSLCRTLKRQHIATAMDNSKNASDVWSILSPFYKPNSASNTVTKLSLNSNGHNTLVTNKYDIANLFGSHFSSISGDPINIDTNDINNLVPNIRSIIEPFTFPQFTADDVLKSYNSLKKKSQGPNSIPFKILKVCDPVIFHHLASLFNISISEGNFPNIWKCAIVKPIHKKGDKTLPINYRPISLLSFLSKIFEKCVSKFVKLFLNRFNILSSRQFGFRPSHSTETACVNILDFIYSNLDRKVSTVATFIDFSKAFDVLPHQLILHMLYIYNFDEVSIRWFASYLHNRFIQVSVDDIAGERFPICSGVPQGSILGPLLFIIATNFIPNILNCHITMYADDCTILSTGLDIPDIVCNLNNDLDRFSHVCTKLGLIINIPKTKVMYFSRNKISYPVLPTIIQGQIIEQVFSFKLLGLHIDHYLTWSDHISHVCSRLSKCVFLLHKAKHFLSCKHLRMIINAVALPHIFYCLILYSNCSRQLRHEVQVRFNECSRIALGWYQYSSGSEARLALRFSSIDAYIAYFKILFVWKAALGKFPDDINNKLTSINHNHNTRFRSKNNFSIRAAKSNIGKRSFEVWGPTLWASLPVQFKMSTSKHCLKNSLMTSIHLLTDLMST